MPSESESDLAELHGELVVWEAHHLCTGLESMVKLTERPYDRQVGTETLEAFDSLHLERLEQLALFQDAPLIIVQSTATFRVLNCERAGAEARMGGQLPLESVAMWDMIDPLRTSVAQFCVSPSLTQCQWKSASGRGA